MNVCVTKQQVPHVLLAQPSHRALMPAVLGRCFCLVGAGWQCFVLPAPSVEESEPQSQVRATQARRLAPHLPVLG